MYNYYLLYNDYFSDKETGIGQLGHLLAFNPGPEDADLDVTVYYEDREADKIKLVAYKETSTESNWEGWKKVNLGSKFSYKVESPVPLACQVTIGCNNTANDYSVNENTRPDMRECVMAYTAINELSREWYLPDGLVIDNPGKIWVRESEWLIVLNPGDEKADITLNMMYSNEKLVHSFSVESGRTKYIYMDDIAKRNSHYGAYVTSSTPVAAQWVRTVNWYDRKELMSYWSVPMVPGPLR